MIAILRKRVIVQLHERLSNIAGLPNITSVSDDINARLDTVNADPPNVNRHLGVLVMDHVTASRVGEVVSTNLQ